ncbi:Myoz3 [Lemmus lemmus]
MIPKEQKEPAMAVTGDLAEPGKVDPGLYVPQVMAIQACWPQGWQASEGSTAVSRFGLRSISPEQILAGSARGKVAGRAAQVTQVLNGPEEQNQEEQNHHSELHVSQGSPGDPRTAHSGVTGVESFRSPSALAPGYAEPLKGIPPEKFNHTAIPKGYRCPWQEFVSYRDYPSRSVTPIVRDYRNFNKTPVPFGGPHVGETVFQAGTPFVPEPFSGLELLRLRPSFNRVAQGWVRKLPESEEL